MRQNKYNARRVTLFGHTFDSRVESYRYLELKERADNGEIHDLQVHPRFELQPAFTDGEGKRQRAITYEADFSYREGDARVVEDVKGGRATQTAAFRLKAKMFRYRYPGVVFRIVER